MLAVIMLHEEQAVGVSEQGGTGDDLLLSARVKEDRTSIGRGHGAEGRSRIGGYRSSEAQFTL